MLITTFQPASLTPKPVLSRKSFPPDHMVNNPECKFVDAGKPAICDNKFDVVLPDTAKLFDGL